MKQVWITKAGPPEVLKVQEAQDPQAQASQVRIRVKAAGINFADLSARVGLYPDAPPIPCVVGYEVSGVIDQVGTDVTRIKVGDRVFGMPRFGGYTDTLVLPEGQVFRMPESMTFEEAAGLPVAYLTAHHMMIFTGNLRKGCKVLIHSAAGGVGIAAIQIAKAYDCEIFGTASTSKHDFLRSLGVHHTVDSSQNIETQVRALLGPNGGLDMVLDPVGGKSWKEGYRLLGPAGRLVAFGMSSAVPGSKRNLLKAIATVIKIPKFNPMTMMGDNKSVSGVNMGHLFDRLDLLTPQFENLIKMYEEGKIKPYIDRSFSFENAAEAHQYLHDRKAKGKVVLVP